MSIFRISNFIAYDHTQGALMLYLESGLRLVPQQFITGVMPGTESVIVVCEGKHMNETFAVESRSPEDDVEAIEIILEDY